MNELSIPDALDIVQSDMKLWDKSETEPLPGGAVRKSINLPWGIGEVSATLEGMNDAEKRRAAVGAYANYIRDIVKQATDDEAVTSRAKAQAARSEQVDSADGVRSGTEGVPVAATEATPVEGADEAYEEATEGAAGFGEALTARRTALSERIGRVESDLARWRRELKGIDAALAAMEDEDGSD